MHEFSGVEMHPAMAMSARPPNCVSNGGHKVIWFSERIRTRMHPEPYQLSIESGAMATAERFIKVKKRPNPHIRENESPDEVFSRMNPEMRHVILK